MSTGQAASALRTVDVKPNCLSPVEGSSTDPDRFSATLAHLAAAGMPRKLYLAARLAYLLDRSVCRELAAHLLAKLADTVSREGWRVPRPGYLTDICWLAMAETLEPRRFRDDQLKRVWMDCDEREWRVTGPRYQRAWELLTDWHQAALHQISRRLEE